MKTKTVKVYQFNELSEKAKEQARAWMRESMQGDEFYAEGVIDDAKAIGKLMGIDISNVYYSGFYSQGDGACFEGSYSYAKGSVKAVTEYAPQDTELHRIASQLAICQRKNFYLVAGNIKQSGHYSNSHNTNINLYVTEDNHGNEPKFSGNTEEAIADLLRDFMDWIYKMLRTEYEYQNSDEQVDETIRINEYNFDENGSRRMTL